jgi:hypothetical protein
MRFLFFMAVSAVLSQFSCKGSEQKAAQAVNPVEQAATQKALKGFWINATFIARARTSGSVAQTLKNQHLPFAYMLLFDETAQGKITISNGIEARQLDCVHRGDTTEILRATLGKSILLVREGTGRDEKITMLDNTTGLTVQDEFRRARVEQNDGNLIWAQSLNYNLFGDKFRLGNQPVQFNMNGSITGLSDWTAYQVCLRATCLKAGTNIDVMNLSNKNTGKQELFAWKYGINQDTLHVFKLQPAKGDSLYTMRDKVYSFVRMSDK